MHIGTLCLTQKVSYESNDETRMSEKMYFSTKKTSDQLITKLENEETTNQQYNFPNTNDKLLARTATLKTQELQMMHV